MTNEKCKGTDLLENCEQRCHDITMKFNVLYNDVFGIQIFLYIFVGKQLENVMEILRNKVRIIKN